MLDNPFPEECSWYTYLALFVIDPTSVQTKDQVSEKRFLTFPHWRLSKAQRAHKRLAYSFLLSAFDRRRVNGNSSIMRFADFPDPENYRSNEKQKQGLNTRG